jgi:hypothetical protein
MFVKILDYRGNMGMEIEIKDKVDSKSFDAEQGRLQIL